MSQAKTAALIARYYQAFNEGDMHTFLSLLHDDVVHDVNQGERRQGKARFAEFMSHMNHCYQEQIRDLVIMVSEDGRRASAEFCVHGRYLNSDSDLPAAQGQQYVLPAGAFFAIHQGQIARITNYYNLQDWLQQVSA
ncbi:ketosteroid isomerase-related protein [Balneatrix alpica]|uniref:ketosteroid isomerase-related protein n=1 Tax=Balneatrix alpica TaxID=75684 RepID=UPI002738D100|nr:ketosteroid isomerase-related protein [Balneatrix alpica]